MSRTAGHAHGFLSSVLTWGCPRTWLGTAGGGRASRGPPHVPWAGLRCRAAPLAHSRCEPCSVNDLCPDLVVQLNPGDSMR